MARARRQSGVRCCSQTISCTFLNLRRGGVYAAFYALKPQLFVRIRTWPYPILLPYTCPSSRTARRASLLLYTVQL